MGFGPETHKMKSKLAASAHFQTKDEWAVIQDPSCCAMQDNIRENTFPVTTTESPIQPYRSRRSPLIGPSIFSTQEQNLLEIIVIQKRLNLPIIALSRLALFLSAA
jgi:hypothetical protein